MIDRKLLDLVACPLCKSPLVVTREKDALVCRAERLAFPVRDEVPILLEEQARSLSTDELAEVTSKPTRLFD